MKPCSTNRKLIAWLALDALDVKEARELRAHLETCEGCRRYMEEISNVTERLAKAEAEPAIQASESFHQVVVRRLQTEAPGSFSPTVVARLQAMLLNWRVVLPVIGATAAVIAVFSVFESRPSLDLPATTGAQAVLTPGVKQDLEPTLSNYQVVANRSLEELDELLTRQGNRNPPPTPLYTASTLPRANGSD
jgi:anti-sigma factor RsiW